VDHEQFNVCWARDPMCTESVQKCSNVITQTMETSLAEVSARDAGELTSFIGPWVAVLHATDERLAFAQHNQKSLLKLASAI
jgi:hypothetical protein